MSATKAMTPPSACKPHDATAPEPPTLFNVELAKLRVDMGTQQRVKINEDAVDDYRRAYADGEDVPPMDVFRVGEEYVVANGHHRKRAADAHKMIRIDVNLYHGTLRDAVLFSVGANRANGLRMLNEDKRRAVATMLADEEWSKWSSRAIATQAGVSPAFVDNMRNKLPTVGSSKTAKIRIGADGKARKLPPKKPAKPKPIVAKSVAQELPPLPEYEPFDGRVRPQQPVQDAVPAESTPTPAADGYELPEPALQSQPPPNPLPGSFNWGNEQERLNEIRADLLARCPVFHKSKVAHLFECMGAEFRDDYDGDKPFNWLVFHNHVIDTCDRLYSECPESHREKLSELLTAMGSCPS